MVETLLYLNETKKMNIKITGLVRNLENGRKRFSHYIGDNKLQLVKQDVCDEIKIDENVDYIIHAASKASPKFFWSDPVGTILPNIVGTANLLKLAVKKRVKTFMLFSTSGVYGFVGQSSYPIKEDCFGYLNPRGYRVMLS
ncbi:MAG TPA: hypothetical protein DHV62_09715 [Elusimicrobia bacterium]|jgi:nucleoside-diphosphate-sugar epimerase|nr:hypothetical protein [Elusimicrobiota bacterium]